MRPPTRFLILLLKPRALLPPPARLFPPPFPPRYAAKDDCEAWEKAWETLVLLLIGESLPEADKLNGVYIMDKTKGRTVSYRLEIWAKAMTSPPLSRQITDLLSFAKPKSFAHKV